MAAAIATRAVLSIYAMSQGVCNAIFICAGIPANEKLSPLSIRRRERSGSRLLNAGLPATANRISHFDRSGGFRWRRALDLFVPHRDGGQSILLWNDGKGHFATSTNIDQLPGSVYFNGGLAAGSTRSPGTTAREPGMAWPSLTSMETVDRRSLRRVPMPATAFGSTRNRAAVTLYNQKGTASLANQLF